MIKLSPNGKTLIYKFEGFSTTAYTCPAGELTIGAGITNYDSDITGIKITKGLKLSKEKLDSAFDKVIARKYAPAVEQYAIKYGWEQDAIDAMISFVFNLGTNAIVQLTKNGTRSNDEISRKIPEYCHSNGVVNKGLQERREKEKELFLKGCGAIMATKKDIVFSGIWRAKCPLNVRAGGGTKYDVIYTLTERQAVNCQGYYTVVNGTPWIKISVGKIEGYCNIKYLRMSPEDACKNAAEFVARMRCTHKGGTTDILSIMEKRSLNCGIFASIIGHFTGIIEWGKIVTHSEKGKTGTLSESCKNSLFCCNGKWVKINSTVKNTKGLKNGSFLVYDSNVGIFCNGAVYSCHDGVGQTVNGKYTNSNKIKRTSGYCFTYKILWAFIPS